MAACCVLRNSVLPTGAVTRQERRSRSEDISMFVDMVKYDDKAYRLHNAIVLGTHGSSLHESEPRIDPPWTGRHHGG